MALSGGSPVGLPEVDEGLLHHLAHKHHELVQPQAVDAEPLPPHGRKEHPEARQCHLEVRQCTARRVSALRSAGMRNHAMSVHEQHQSEPFRASFLS